jgi:hypothetical protein
VPTADGGRPLCEAMDSPSAVPGLTKRLAAR